MNIYEVKGVTKVDVTVYVEAENEDGAVDVAARIVPFLGNFSGFSGSQISCVGVDCYGFGLHKRGHGFGLQNRCHGVKLNPADYVTYDYDNVRSIGPAPEKQYD